MLPAYDVIEKTACFNKISDNTRIPRVSKYILINSFTVKKFDLKNTYSDINCHNCNACS